MSTKLIAKDLEMVFDGKRTLNKVNFSVQDGEFLSILGPSGCGKSTIAKLVSGLYEPWSGSVCFDGMPIDEVIQ